MPKEYQDFYGSKIEVALASCQNAGYRALFMPELIDLRVKNQNSRAWDWCTTTSAVMTWRTDQGTPIVVFAHTQNYLSEPQNIIKAREEGLIRGAAIIPRAEFQRTLGQEDNKNVFVADYKKIVRAGLSTFGLSNASKHPITLPFLGVSKDEAGEYLKKDKQRFVRQSGLWYNPKDLSEEPLGRLLSIGYQYRYNDCYEFVNWFSGVGHLFGVRDVADTQKIEGLETVVAALNSGKGL